MAKTSERANFSSKLGVVLATAGSAVGLGNVWRFPYMTGQNGGAAFIIIYVVCVLLLGIPCMVSEFIIGRRGAANTARAYDRLAKGSPWKFVGYLGVLTGFLITGYYAVVSGWCLQYVYGAVVGGINGDANYVQQYFQSFCSDPFKPILWAVVFLAITHLVIVRGVRNGIERVAKMMMPTLFVLLLVIVVASCMLPGAGKGLAFLFNPDFSKVDHNVFLSALGQSFYSLSIAMGCICTYASYFSRHTHLLGAAVQISVVDCLVAILAGMMIFPAAFSVGINPDSGASLVFITLPNVFHQAFASMPVVGYVVAVMFYLLLAVAALTSLISLHEVSTAFLQEEMHISRARAALIITTVCGVIGAFCSLSLGAWDGLQLFGKSLFDLFDFVTGQIFLPVGGLLTCLFIGWVVPRKVVREEFTNWETISGTFFGIYFFCVRYVCPVCIVLILLHQFGVFKSL